MDAFGADHFGEEAANSYQRGLHMVFARLEAYPYSGEERTDYGNDIRCIAYRSHRVLYRAQADGVLIVRVLHHSRDAPRHLPE